MTKPALGLFSSHDSAGDDIDVQLLSRFFHIRRVCIRISCRRSLLLSSCASRAQEALLGAHPSISAVIFSSA